MTYEDLKRIDVECVWWTHSKGTDWRYLGEKDLERARLVLVENMKQADVARAQGVSAETISHAVRRARRGAQKLGIEA